MKNQPFVQALLSASIVCLAAAAQAVVYRPGLIQAKFNTTKDYASVIATHSSAERVPGTVMADVQANENNYATQTYSNTVTGTKYAWNKQNTTFGYAGQLHATAGTTYTFGKYLDDGTRIIVGGRQLMDDPTYNAFVVAAFATNAPGWYDVEIRIYDGTGGKGPSGGDWGTDLGLGWNTNKLNTIAPKSGWTRLRDPGDMSWFRTVISTQSYSGVSSMTKIDTSVDVDVAYTNLPAVVSVTAYVDSADRGTSAESWATSTSLGTIPAGTGMATLTIPYDSGKPIARILLSRRGVGDDIFDEWLSPIDLSTAPVPSGADFRFVADSVFTNAVVTLTVTSMGEAESAQFTLLVSPNADYSAPVFSNAVGSAVTAVNDVVSVNLAPLATNTTYYVKTVLAGDGASRTRETTLVTGAPVSPAASTTFDLAKSDSDSAVFSGVVSVIGTSRADVFFDYSTTSDFASYTTVVLSQNVTQPYSFTDLDVAIPSGQSVYGRVRVVNDWNFTACSETMYFALGPVVTAAKHASFISPAFTATLTDAGRQGAKVTRVTLAVWDNSALTGSPVFTKDYTVDIAAFPTTTAILQAYGFGASQTYYARVEARNDLGYDNVSTVVSFTTPAAGDNVWANTSSDVESAASYVYTWGKPAANKILYFETPAVVSPVIASDTTLPTLFFGTTNRVDTIAGGYNACGYELTGSGKITLSDESPVRQSTYGTNLVSNPILFNRSNNQSVKLSPTAGSVVFGGPLSTPAGAEVELVSLSSGNVHFRGDTQGMRIKQLTTGQTAYIYIENANALTNAMKIYFELGWGAFRKIQNNTGAPLVFATTNLSITTGWSCPRVCFYGAPFLFPQGTFVWSPRADDNSMDADFAIRDLVLLKHDGDSRFVKRGAGIFSVTNATIYSDDAQKNYVRVYEGCYFPRTDAAWAPSRQVFIESSNGTVGLNEDYYPMMNASHAHRVLGINTANAWGFTAFGGDRVVCYNNDPSFAVTNRSTGGSNANFTDTTTVAQLDPTKKLSAYYAWPQRFVFGNRSPMADGTILFKNPMEQLLNEDQYTYFESTNRVVAVRLQGKINVGHRDRTWYFDGRSVGGCGAVEADNTNFIGRVNVRNLATLLVNGPLEARSVTVATTSGLGGTNRVGGAEGVTVQTGGTIFGGEYGRGGSLTVDSALTMQANALLRADIPADPAAGIGYVKLANTDPAKKLTLTAPIGVRLDVDPAAYYRGSVKLLDWSGAAFEGGATPQLETFVPDIPEGSNVRNMYLSVQGSALYAAYVLDTVPIGTMFFVR